MDINIKTIIKRKSAGRLLIYAIIGTMAVSFPACDDKLNNGDSGENSSGVGLLLNMGGIEEYNALTTRAQMEPQTVVATTDDGFIAECTLAPEPVEATRATITSVFNGCKYRVILFNGDFSKRTTSGQGVSGVTNRPGVNNSFLCTAGTAARLTVPWWSSDEGNPDRYVRVVAYSTYDSSDPDGQASNSTDAVRELDNSTSTYTVDPTWDFLYFVSEPYDLFGYGVNSIHSDAQEATITFKHRFTYVQAFIDISSIPNHSIDVPTSSTSSGFTYTIGANSTAKQTFTVNGPPEITNTPAAAVYREWRRSGTGNIYEYSYSGRTIFTGNTTDIAVTFSGPITVRYHDGTSSHATTLPTVHFQGPLLTGTKYRLTVKLKTNDTGAVTIDCDDVKYYNAGNIIRTGTTLSTQKIVIAAGALHNGTSSQISGSITASTTAGITFSGNVTIPAYSANSSDIVLQGSGTNTAAEGTDLALTWTSTPFTISTDMSNCLTVPVGLGAVRILFADNSGPVDAQSWGPNGLLGVPGPSNRSTAIIGALTRIDANNYSVGGSVNFGPSGTVKTKWIPYTEGQIYMGGFDLRANNGNDAAAISAVCTNPNIPNPNVMVYATENWVDEIGPAVTALVQGGSWIVYTTKHLGNGITIFYRPDDLGKVLTAAGFSATSGQAGTNDTPNNFTLLSSPAVGSPAEKILNGPFGNLEGQTVDFDGSHYLVGVSTLPSGCEILHSTTYQGANATINKVMFVCTNTTTHGGIIVLGKNVSAGTGTGNLYPAQYPGGVPYESNAKLEMNALNYALEQSTAWDARNK
ncbi:MAG: hypothetical protein LBR48_09655 [Dysgonamonadaceae bacterium]|jgi:hypothetical protein|nr:hypothetical protein [Dysgonamonadaceae bacterium]